MATKKISIKPVPKTKTTQPASKAKPAAGSKPAVKHTVAKKTAVKSSAPRSTAVSVSPKPAAVRAAEVEANIGGSRSLTDFLTEIEWYK